MGRPKKHYETSWGQTILGLTRGPDKRWRDIATGKKWTDANEQRAVRTFLSLQKPDAMITLPGVAISEWESGDEIITDPVALQQIEENHTLWPKPTTRITEETILNWVRHQILNHGAEFARKLGIPQVAELANMGVVPSVSILKMRDTYLAQNGSTPSQAIKDGITTFDMMITQTKAKTLSDLTTEALKDFRDSINQSARATGTKKVIFSRCKAVISYGLKQGIDAKQIQECLSRMKILHCDEIAIPPAPTPLSRQDFETLCKNEKMKRWVLVGLNLCMHLGEVRDLLWKDFDLDKGTYYAIRNKTKRRRIPRAATLWPETIEVLKKLYNPKHTYVFTSRYGSKYSRTYSTTFFRGKADKLGLHDLTFESIRDGSYTAAIRAPGVDEKFARLLAGHASQGLQDSYVARNPEMVKSACDAVRKYYLG